MIRAYLLLLTCIVAAGPYVTLVAQEPVPLIHRWITEPNLDCFYINREKKEIFVDLTRLKSSVDAFQLSEARNIAQSDDQIQDKYKADAIGVIMQTLRGKAAKQPVRQALVSALLKLTDGNELEELWKLTSQDEALRPFVENALIDWEHAAAKAVWLTRLENDSEAEVDLHLAIRGVASIKAQEAREALIKLIQSDALGLPTKMIATRSLGAISNAGLEPLASELLGSQRFAKEQLAAQLLVNHPSDAARELMLQISQTNFEPAHVIAYRWIAEYAPELARELAESMLQHVANEIRLQAVNVLHRFDDAVSLQLQGRLLKDRNVIIRRTVRDHLIEKSQIESLEETIDEILTEHLKGEHFEGAEQAIVVVEALGKKERCPRLVELLDYPRPEVAIRAAWALQQLVHAPEDLAGILVHCQRWTERIEVDPGQQVAETDVIRLAFAFQALGHNAYMPADQMLRIYIPKNGQKMRTNTRIAAIWALGEIWRGRHDSELEQPIAERMLDPAVIDAEAETVKYASAITLGKIGNPISIPQLESVPEKMPAPIGHAVKWSLEQFSR